MSKVVLIVINVSLKYHQNPLQNVAEIEQVFLFYLLFYKFFIRLFSQQIIYVYLEE